MSKARQTLVYAAWAVLVVIGIATGVAVQKLWVFRSGLERLADRLTLDVGPESTLIYDANNNLVSALFEEHRIAVRLEEMSPHLVNAVLVTEDRRFYDHDGLDLRRIAMAAVANQRAGEIVQGGSTITQQLVRSILLSREQNYTRKIKEAILARRLEERYAKKAILESYLNRVYFGGGYYGVEAAAIGYFGKPAAQLDAVESATLAGLIKGPSVYSPTKAPELARQRRDLVLNEMRAAGMLSDQDFQRGVAVPVITSVAREARTTKAPDPRRMRGAEYFREAVSRELLHRFGAEAVYTGGLRVYTTLDRRLQAIAEESVANRLKRMPQARANGEPRQGALVAIEPTTGFVKAIVGGRDFDESPFNRAIDAKRQPGSTFKPFIYAQALESGFSPSSQLDHLDQPIPTQQGPWLPGGEHEVASVRLREGLVLSSNRAAAHLLQQVGVRRTLDLVTRFGISSPMPNVPSVALGTGEVSLFELTSAYSVFANRGVWRVPTTIRRVEDRYGREIYTAPQTERAVISEATAYLMTSMMSDVVNRGTATGVRAAGFTRQAAGKTGTSNDYTDAWFVGYTPQLVTGVWFGYDKPQMIMNRGFAGVVAVPAWARFMMAATQGSQESWFEMPGSLVTVKLCRISGMLATDRCHMSVIEAAPYDPDNPDVLTSPAQIVKQGGVYEEIRNIGRMPDVCPLLHGGSDPMHYAQVDSAADVSPRPAAPAPTSSTVIYSPTGGGTVPPPSMLPPTSQPRSSVMTISPAAIPPPAAPAAAPAATTENPILPTARPGRAPETPEPPPISVVPGSTISNAPPAPPRPAGNRSPGV
ncbi:MAG TPA: PBP1A family penicillin-binding protein [Vicinamibacterales bacterium]|nr:PBP1A family penicillin-binding protein [Vicinamibacterales bacterium]